MEKELGKIISTHLGIEDHGIMSFMIVFDFGGRGRGFGGYALDTYDEKLKKRVGTAYGMEVIMRILNAVGVDKWEDLVGKVCWVYRAKPYDEIVAIKAPDFVKQDGLFDIVELGKKHFDSSEQTKTEEEM